MEKKLKQTLHKALNKLNKFILATQDEILHSRKLLNKFLNKEVVKDYIEYERYCK